MHHVSFDEITDATGSHEGHFTYQADYFELINAPEKAEAPFRPGDLVLRTGESTGINEEDGHVLQGRHYRVRALDRDGGLILTHEHESTTWGWDETCFELVKRAEDISPRPDPITPRGRKLDLS